MRFICLELESKCSLSHVDEETKSESRNDDGPFSLIGRTEISFGRIGVITGARKALI